MEKKAKGRDARKFRICVLGPSFVGKTQVINRFVNNTFSYIHDETLDIEVYKRAYNILEDQDVDP